ncbi:unnamed protein product [Caenorhabditis bovis]|uniref:TATA box-binding protein-like 1 n=1 Tax=Caenorhabditis bovis TaxID=2654633 RepID=A0A8S1F578_9PELO|nr:unnamed protein product [Caenorhabditis bovis]
MSVEHDYAFANATTKKPTPIQSQTGEPRTNRVIAQMPAERRIYCVPKPVQQVVPQGQSPQTYYEVPTRIATTNRPVNGQPTRVLLQQGTAQVIRPGTQYTVVSSANRLVQGQQHSAVRAQPVFQGGQVQQIYRRTPQGNVGQQTQATYIQVARTTPSQQQGATTAVYTQQPIRQYVQPMQQQQQAQGQRATHHQPQQQAQFAAFNSMNLAVPLREPSPEPIAAPPPQPEPEESAQSTSNEEPMPDDSDIDIQIRNVVCNYTLPLHIDLRKLAMNTNNVTYEREKGVMMKQKRNPNCYIKVYSSGKVYIVGCRSEVDCKRAARSIARHVQRVMGRTNERVAIRNYRVNNVLATCRMPFGIKIEEVAAKYPSESTYEPELSVGLVWRSVKPKATLRIHTTGSITVTGASSENDVLEVISTIYPIVLKYRCFDRAKDSAGNKRKRKAPANKPPAAKRERLDQANFGSSGVYNNKVYFSDEDEDLYEDLDLDE